MPAPWCGPYSLGRTLKPEREAGTAGVAVLNRNARHMRVGNAPHDCKAEARASRLTAIMTPKTTNPPENHRCACDRSGFFFCPRCHMLRAMLGFPFAFASAGVPFLIRFAAAAL